MRSPLAPRALPRMRPPPRWIVRWAIAFASLLLALAALELGLRAKNRRVMAAEGATWAVPDPDLGYRVRPGFQGANSLGLRDDEVGPKGDRVRVLVLGDSVAFYGDGPQDTFPGHAERELAGRTARPVDVVNAGAPGYTNYQELVFLRKFGVALEPDVVCVAFVLNDLHRVLAKFVGEQFRGTRADLDTIDDPWTRTVRKSALLRFVSRRWVRLVRPGDEFDFHLNQHLNTAWKDEPWRVLEEQLGEMVELGVRHGFRVCVVVFPIGQQYRADYLERDREHVLEPQRRMEQVCERLGLPCLDLHPVLEGGGNLVRDGIHLTAVGRRRTGEAVAEFLVREGLVPVRGGVDQRRRGGGDGIR